MQLAAHIGVGGSSAGPGAPATDQSHSMWSSRCSLQPPGHGCEAQRDQTPGGSCTAPAPCAPCLQQRQCHEHCSQQREERTRVHGRRAASGVVGCGREVLVLGHHGESSLCHSERTRLDLASSYLSSPASQAIAAGAAPTQKGTRQRAPQLGQRFAATRSTTASNTTPPQLRWGDGRTLPLPAP